MDHRIQFKCRSAVSSVSSCCKRLISVATLNSDISKSNLISQNNELFSGCYLLACENHKDILNSSERTGMSLDLSYQELEETDLKYSENSVNSSVTSFVSYLPLHTYPYHPLSFDCNITLNSSPYTTYAVHFLPAIYQSYRRKFHSLQYNCHIISRETIKAKNLVCVVNRHSFIEKLGLQSLWTGLHQFVNITSRFLQLVIACYSFLLSKMSSGIKSDSLKPKDHDSTTGQPDASQNFPLLPDSYLCSTERSRSVCLPQSESLPMHHFDSKVADSQQVTEATLQCRGKSNLKPTIPVLNFSVSCSMRHDMPLFGTSEQWLNSDDADDSAICTLSTPSIESCVTSLDSVEFEHIHDMEEIHVELARRQHPASASSFFVSPSQVDSDDAASECDSDGYDTSSLTDAEENTELCFSDPFLMSGIILSQLTDDGGSSSGGSRSNSFSLVESELDNREDTVDNSDDEIIFCEDDGSEDETIDPSLADSILQVNSRWDSYYGSISAVISRFVECGRMVHFAEATDLVTVHEEPTGEADDYFEARRGPWEEYARDRDRFQKRIRDTELALSSVFEPTHRDRIYKRLYLLSSGH